jgi:hypothetical protein
MKIQFDMPDYGPLPAGVTENMMMDRMGRPKDHPVSIEHARRAEIDKARRQGVNTGAYHDINMVNAPRPINTAGPIKYKPHPWGHEFYNSKHDVITRQVQDLKVGNKEARPGGPKVLGGMDLSTIGQATPR